MNESTVESSTGVSVELTEKSAIRVLHVDDDTGFLKIAKECLEMQGGFQAETASCVEEAKDKLRREKHDVIVSDYQMPGKDGLEFLKELREEGNDIPFIIFTGKGREEIAVKALNLGADGYFDKHGEPETVYCELAHGIRLAAEKEKAGMKAFREEERLRAILASSPDAIMISDLEGKVVDCNEAALKLGGYSSKEEVIGKNAFEFIAEKDRKRALENLKNTFEQGTTNNIEYSLLKMNGKEYQGELSASILRDAHGNPAGFVAITRDVSERKNVEEQIRKTSEELGRTFDAVTDIMFVVDKNYRFVRVSKKTCEFLKKKPEELIGKHCYEVLHGTREPWPNCPHTKTLETKEPASAEIDDPNIGIPLLVTISPIYDEKGEFTQSIHIAKDITERKKAEQLLRASLERYQYFIEVTGELGWIANADGEVVEDIPSFKRFTGQTYEEVKGMGWSKALHPDDLERTTRLWKEATLTRSKYEVEYRLRRHDGVYRHFMARGVPVLKEDGSIREWVGTCIDITERKKTEETLIESEQKYRSLVESSPDGIITLNMKGTVTSVNTSMLKLIGYDSEKEIVGKNFTRLKTIRKRDIPRFLKVFASMLTGKETGVLGCPFVRKDGELRWTDANAGFLKKDGKTVGIQVIARDITDRRNAEIAVRESQEKFEQLFMGSPEAAVSMDQDFHVLEISPSFTQLFGYSLEEIKGKHINDVVVPEDKMTEAEFLDKKTAKGYVHHDAVRRRKDGTLVPVLASAASIKVNGKLVGHVGTYQDISQLKRTEADLAILNEKLRVIGGLTRHDVRNKLSAVTGNAYLLKKQLAGDKEAFDKLTDIETAVQQTVRIFDSAKTYELLGAEELTFVNVEKSINEAISLFSELKGVAVTNDCHGLTVLADSLLQQLFYNLIDNSLKYGEKITQIRIHYEKTEEDQLKLIYEDDGVGISQDAKAKLFNQGYTTGKGSGYGLFLIKRMMEVYGWTIRETGTPGKGVQFIVTIPKTKKEGKENYLIP